MKYNFIIREIDKHTLEYRFFVNGKLIKRSQFNKKTKIYSDNLPINNHQKLMGEQMESFISLVYKLCVSLLIIAVILIVLLVI